jgi:hypothetical protein
MTKDLVIVRGLIIRGVLLRGLMIRGVVLRGLMIRGIVLRGWRRQKLLELQVCYDQEEYQVTHT